MNKFFDSPECRSGTHCRTCRNSVAGASFRTSIAAYFNLATTDWDCPHGRPWELDCKVEALPFIKTTIAERASGKPAHAPTRKPASSVPPSAEEICYECASRTCPNVTVCCGGRVDVVIVAPCPDAKW